MAVATPGTTVYSFKDTTGVFSHPIIGDFILTGQNLGAGRFIIKNTVTRSAIDTSSDGTAVTSYISGSNGEFDVECQQTSAIHKYFLACANAGYTAADSGDVSLIASSLSHLQNIVDGSQHVMTGISFVKIPDKEYEKQSKMITWSFLASNVVSQ